MRQSRNTTRSSDAWRRPARSIRHSSNVTSTTDDSASSAPVRRHRRSSARRAENPGARSPAQSTSLTIASTRSPKSTVGGWSSRRSGGYGEISDFDTREAYSAGDRALRPSYPRAAVTSGGDDALWAVRRPRHLGVALAIDIDEQHRCRLALDLDLVPRGCRVARAEVTCVVARPELVEAADVDAHRVTAAAPLDDRVRGEEQRACNLALEAALGIALEALRHHRACLDRPLHCRERGANRAPGSLMATVGRERPPRRIRLGRRRVRLGVHDVQRSGEQDGGWWGGAGLLARIPP